MTASRLLSIGSGPHYADGWLNVDIHEPPAGCRPPDQYVSVYQLSDHFDPDSFDRVYVGHVLEHLEWDLIPQALREIDHVLAPGGEMMVVGPCILRAVATGQPEWLLTAILADPRQPPDGCGHAWTPTTELTLEAVQSVFSSAEVLPVVDVHAPRWPNPSNAPWQCAVLARKAG